MLSGEAAETKFIAFGLTRPGFESMIYHTQGITELNGVFGG
jgi:hypothetical protein